MQARWWCGVGARSPSSGESSTCTSPLTSPTEGSGTGSADDGAGLWALGIGICLPSNDLLALPARFDDRDAEAL